MPNSNLIFKTSFKEINIIDGNGKMFTAFPGSRNKEMFCNNYRYRLPQVAEEVDIDENYLRGYLDGYRAAWTKWKFSKMVLYSIREHLIDRIKDKKEEGKDYYKSMLQLFRKNINNIVDNNNQR